MANTQTDAPPPIQPPPPIAPVASSPSPNPESQARTWNMLCHLSALAGFIGVPLGNILGPLVVWLIKKNEIPSVDMHGKRALNFQITATLTLLVGGFLAFALSFFCMGFLLIPLLVGVALADLIFTIIAAVKASNGEDYKYPCCFEFIT